MPIHECNLLKENSAKLGLYHVLAPGGFNLSGTYSTLTLANHITQKKQGEKCIISAPLFLYTYPFCIIEQYVDRWYLVTCYIC